MFYLLTSKSMRTVIDQARNKKLPYYEAVFASFPKPPLDDPYLGKEIDITRFMVQKPTATFILKMRGDAMIGEGIKDGDYLVVDRSAKKPKEYEIVIATVDDRNGWLVRSFRKDEDGISYLRAANPEFLDICPEESLIIQGRVVGVFRRFPG